MKKPIIPILILTTLFATALIANATLPPLSPPPVGGYDSGSNSILDPGCAPGTPNCWVNLSSGGSITANNGLTATGSNVQLGGTLLNNTTITTGGREFIVQGMNSKLVSGADPLDLFPLIGEAFPGTAMSTDGTSTGGVKSWVGSLISPSNNKALTVVGNFDIANGIQAAMVAEDTEINIYSSDGMSGSSNIQAQVGGLSFSASGGINFYTPGYINFNNFSSSRDDSGTNFPTNFLYTDGSGNLQSAPTSLLGDGGSLKWYAENAIAPITPPIATGFSSIAFGDGAEALASEMFVFGNRAGENATGAGLSNFFGSGAGLDAINASGSNFLGYYAGLRASNASYSNFFSEAAGSDAANASYSNFFGRNAGRDATNANNSNFFGNNAGQNAANAGQSNFIGFNAGRNATSANNSNFFGNQSGFNATNAYESNFIGPGAGQGATNASYSNFFGGYAGKDATNVFQVNFFGINTGEGATNAYLSNFFGRNAGSGATNANNSIFIGNHAGFNDTVNNSAGGTSILIGDDTSTGGFSNSIALGKGAINTTTNQLMIGSTTSPINETKIIGSLGTECTITTGTGMACSSDERLKTNITEFTNSDILQKLQNIKTVSYNWKENPNSPLQIGFLAQNLEQQFPELVITDATGKKQVYYSQMTPILVAAVKELNLKLSTLELANGSTSTNVFDSLKSWFADTANGIETIIAKVFKADRVETKELCVGQTCLNEQQIQQIIQSVGATSSSTLIPVIQNNTNPGTTDSNSNNSTNSDTAVSVADETSAETVTNNVISNPDPIVIPDTGNPTE